MREVCGTQVIFILPVILSALYADAPAIDVLNYADPASRRNFVFNLRDRSQREIHDFAASNAVVSFLSPP